MFKKLKDKITEEVKSSPQRIQQFTQSVTEKIQSTTNDDNNVFTIGDDDPGINSNMEAGFSNVALSSTPTNMDRDRRSSVTSLASDISFLPRYESNLNAYHLQSDLDVSASEIEDNMSSTSSQIGHISKEQVYSAYQKAQMRYHKYRGRYTDLANHYKELERENVKMKSVLVDTQDKAIRRVAELKEQCSLEQKAKAHLESALRVELDEREYVINTLKTKIDLLQNGKTEQLIDLNNKREENLEMLTKYLNDARLEIENLNAKIQEHKANTIVLQSQTTEYKQKINDLEKLIQDKAKEVEVVTVREKENNLKIAETKMELHAEIQSKDTEIANLKKDIEKLKIEITANEGKEKTSKLENLQTQNAKLIEKIENLTQKCISNESELLKTEQYKIEIKNLNQAKNLLKESNKKQEEEYKKIKDDYQILQENYNKIQIDCSENVKKITTLQEETENLMNKLTKFNEITLKNNELKEKLTQFEGYNEKNKTLVEENKELRKTIGAIETELINLKTSKEALEENLKITNEKLEKDREEMKQSLLQLETKIKEKLIKEYEEKESNLKTEFQTKLQEVSSNELTTKELQIKLVDKENELETLIKKISHTENEYDHFKSKYIDLENNYIELINENDQNMQKAKDYLKKIEILNSELENEKSSIKMLHEDIDLLQQVSSDQQNKICDMEKENRSLKQLEDDTNETKHNELKAKIETLQHELLQINEIKNVTLNEKIKLEKTLDEHKNRMNEYKQQIRILEDENAKNLQEIATQNNQITQLLQQCSELQQENVNLTEKNELQTKSLINCKDYESLKLRLESTETEKDNLIKKTIEDSEKLIEYDAEITNLNTTINKIKQDFIQETNKAKELENLNKEQLKMIAELNEKNQDNENFKQLHETASNELKKLKEENEILTQELKNLNKDLKEETNKLNGENEMLLLQVDNLNGEILNLKEYETKYLNLLDENNNLKEQILQNEEMHNKLKMIETELKNAITKNESYITTNKELLKSNNEYLEEINLFKNEIKTIKEQENSNTSKLKLKEKELQEIQVKFDDYQNKLNLELTELITRNQTLESDYKSAIAENETTLIKLEDLKLKLLTIEDQLTNTNIINAKLTLEKDELLIKVHELENLNLKNNNYKLVQDEKKELEKQLLESESQLNELNHERQLLLDEIQELKTSPLNLNNKENDNTIEIERLQEKIQQYKSLDLTNRTSIKFYENELQKFKNKNEKLNRKLDETLVTLNHCTELSHSTEVEYLKNVLYNYMLGKESLVLARVIAAVCKFDPEQTETVLQREQQKQTLLGQLGII